MPPLSHQKPKAWLTAQMKHRKKGVAGIYAPGPRLTLLSLTLIACVLALPVWLLLALLT